jgi:PAS domain S-box-containing protein
MSKQPVVKGECRQVFESFPRAMLIAGGGKILQANAQAESLFGYDPGQLNGRPGEALFPDQLLELFSGNIAPGKQAVRTVLLVGKRGDSSQFPAEVSIMPLRIGAGPAALMIVEDFTETQRAQFLLHRGMDMLRAEDSDHQALIGRLIKAQEDERARIAADIHDDTIQVISAASLRLQQLRLRLRAPEEVSILDKFEQALTLSLSRLRQLVFDLRPSGVERGVVPTIRADLERMHADTGIRYFLDDRLTTPVPVSAAVPIYRTAREALVNVRKHANAATIWVKLAQVDDGCLVSIIDNGVGYHPAEVESRPGHLGLVLMRERAQLAGGWCRIESSPGAGTTVEFWIPFNGSPSQAETAGGSAS